MRQPDAYVCHYPPPCRRLLFIHRNLSLAKDFSDYKPPLRLALGRKTKRRTRDGSAGLLLARCRTAWQVFASMDARKELLELQGRLSAAHAAGDAPNVSKPLAALKNAAEQIGRSFSGSWLGYHSRMYYAGFRPPPSGANFSPDSGLRRPWVPTRRGIGESAVCRGECECCIRGGNIGYSIHSQSPS
jgi:hypothetical protein